MASAPQDPSTAASTIAPTASPSKVPRDLLIIVTAVQAAYMARYGWAYWELTRTGVTSLLTALISIVSCVLLYVGVFRLLTGRRVRHSLLLAAVGLAWSFFGWNVRFGWSHPFLLGAVIGAFAWWRAVKAPAKSRGAEPAQQ